MDCLLDDLRRSTAAASLLVLTLPACAPKESDSQDGTDTETVSSASTPSTTTPGASSTGSCDAVVCEPCDVLDEQHCPCCAGEDTEENACMEQRGTRLDRERGCVYENVFAVCVPGGACLGWVVAYVDPQGNCWLISEDCMAEGSAVEGWTVDETFDLCPELADWESDPLPPC